MDAKLQLYIITVKSVTHYHPVRGLQLAVKEPIITDKQALGLYRKSVHGQKITKSTISQHFKATMPISVLV